MEARQIVALQQTTAGAYTLPDPGEYEGVTMTVVAIPVPDWFAESHILTRRFVVDGVPKSTCNFQRWDGTTITVTSVQGEGWVVLQSNGVAFS